MASITALQAPVPQLTPLVKGERRVVPYDPKKEEGKHQGRFMDILAQTEQAKNEL